METKTFDEIFQEAIQTSNCRKKIFNELVNRTQTELIPNLAKLIDGYDMENVVIICYTKPFVGMDAVRDEYDDMFYPIGITRTGLIWEMGYRIEDRTYYENYRPTDPKFLRTGILNFVEAVLLTSQKLNEEYSRKNERAEELLKKI